ncbi:translation initiation factor IF-3 [Philodulcilactobacillus myokoensis]|uniref:Translation initiation factor IF-3 n=1 Tax=Philodulcilactobacillus myokoensis TaxID=2929573 RepID=A0A9W6B1N2_9LACO|nr:translation initiation factor IF-3 [Philodulcilactobacillus myokoensis]GLB46753.1 translation initiation factor IF-3 [Philodulcilactobacillus myokoensis]
MINERIRANKVRLIDDQGNQLGIKSRNEALKTAQDRDLDLMLVSPNAKPPVARILNYGKYHFQQQKRARKSRQRQKVVSSKEVRLSPTIDTNDFNTKLNRVKRFIKKGAKVRVSIRFKGRAITHKGIGRDVLEKMANEVSDVANVINHPKMDGRSMFLVLSPIDKNNKNK